MMKPEVETKFRRESATETSWRDFESMMVRDGTENRQLRSSEGPKQLSSTIEEKKGIDVRKKT
jgi:hypothetical protein